MLIIALSVGVAITVATAFITLCLGIRREDRAALCRPAPTFATRQARRFTGLRTTPGRPGAKHDVGQRVRVDA